jgi:hypothetical protein
MKTANFLQPRTLGIIALALVMPSCSTVTKNHATYLKDAQWQVSPTDKRAKVWRSQMPASTFDSFKLGRIQFLAPEAGLSAEQKTALVQRLRTSLEQNFATAWPAKSGTGKSTLEISGAITGADKANVWVNLLADAVLNFPVSTGGVAVELEATSKADGKRVAAGQYIMPGRMWHLIASHTQTGHARLGIDKAARQFFTLVTGKKAPSGVSGKPAAQAKAGT